MQKYRIEPPAGELPRPAREALLTAITFLIYSLAALPVIFVEQQTGYTMRYTDVSRYGWLYTIFSFFIFLFYIDTTFYWSHVLMHRTRVGRSIHKTHHQFINVTPFASYAFHFGEATIDALAFMSMTLIIPWHPAVLFSFIFFQVFYNGMIHLGYNFFPKSWRRHALLKWLNSTSHHIYHHQKSDANFSFFLTFWDKLMKTEKLPK